MTDATSTTLERIDSPDASRRAEHHRDEVLDLVRRHVNAGQSKLAALMGLQVEASSDGAWIRDHDGQRYLDAGGYGVFLLGHGHPRVVAAVAAQLRTHALSTRLLVNEQQARAAAALAAHCPPGLQYVYFANSGAEATEAALKLAQLNGCEAVISTIGGYHGKTLGALGVTGSTKYRERFAGRLAATEFVPFGDIAAMSDCIARQTRRACVILEPIQAEAGVIIPPAGYLGEVRKACNAHGALLILDEIQCGLGRTGRWWASERDDVAGDMMLVGKGLSGGCVPVAAMVARVDVYEPFNRAPLLHSSTFGGNPLAMAAVRATLEAMDEEDIVERTQRSGEALLAGLREVVAGGATAGWPQRVAVRGAGLLIGIEFAEASDAATLVIAMLERRVIVCHSLNDHRVVRLTPPAILTASDIDQLVSAFASALASILQ
jgi:putrescine aminotransferase